MTSCSAAASLTFACGLGIWATTATADSSTYDRTGISSHQRLEEGKRIYRDGILPTGEPVTALVQRDVPLSGQAAACINCHRRSGLGTSEGRELVPPVVGELLRQPREFSRRELYAARSKGAATRPAYSDNTLRRAIREGVDASGRTMDAMMPRYALGDANLDAVLAYLKSLGTSNSPGVTDDTIHFATVVGGDVSSSRRDTMENVLRTYVEAKNAETRAQTLRASNPPWHKEWHYQSYRKWMLHVWELAGPPEAWQAQLDRHYRAQPVFAMISGLSSGPWQPIHQFCEQQKIPCLFPITDLPVISDSDFHYTIYFSQGMALEAKAAAKHLRSELTPQRHTNLVQIFTDDPVSEAAATALRQSLREVGFPEIKQRRVAPQTLGVDFWHEFQHQEQPTALFLWLYASELEGIDALAEQGSTTSRLYFSAHLAGTSADILGRRTRWQTYAIQRHKLSEHLDRHLFRAKAWARAKRIDIGDDEVLGNTYFAVTMLSDAVMQIRSHLIRDYLVERLEHMVDNATFTSVYPQMSLGPEQRYASKGCYILGPSDANTALTPGNATLIVP